MVLRGFVSVTAVLDRCARCAGYGWVRPGSMGFWHERRIQEAPAWPTVDNDYPIEYAFPRAQGAKLCPDCNGLGER